MCRSCKKNSMEYPYLIGKNFEPISVCRCCRRKLCAFCAFHHRWKRRWHRRKVYSFKNGIEILRVPHYPSKVVGRPSINNRRL